MGSWKRTLIIGVSAYLLFLLINIPATFLLQALNKQLPNSAVSLEGAQGTIWLGSTDVVIKGTRQLRLKGRVRLSWSYNFVDLLLGQIGADYELVGAGLEASGEFATGLGPMNLTIDSATVSPDWVNPALTSQGITIAQPVKIKQLYWQFDIAEKRTDAAGGMIDWAGGQVAIKRPQKTLDLPPVRATLSATDQQTLLVEVLEQASKKALLSTELLQTGEAHIRILKRVQPLIDLGQPDSPDAVFLDLKQPVL